MKKQKQTSITCFSAHKNLKVPCDKTMCRQWIQCEKSQNCVIISSSKGPKTLQEIGDIFNLSRMRVCQIEKTIIQKINKNLNNKI